MTAPDGDKALSAHTAADTSAVSVAPTAVSETPLATTSSLASQEKKEAPVSPTNDSDSEDASVDSQPYTAAGTSKAAAAATTTAGDGADRDLEAGQRAASAADGASLRQHDSHRRLSNVLSRIASNAGSVVRHYREELSQPIEHIPVPPFPLGDMEKGIVGWDGPDDPAMPLNFTARKKWTIIAFLSAMTLMTPFASSILAPALETVDKEFHAPSPTVGAFPVSIYLLGYTVGPLFLAGLSEIYGRHIILSLSNAFFCVWQIGCALAPNLSSLIVFRFLAGIGGSACLTMGGACISDLFPVEERGVALSMWAVGPLIGPSVGPIIGAWLTQTIGWRWSFWIVLIPAAIIMIVMAVFSSETSHMVLIDRKVKRLSKELGRDDLRSCYIDPDGPSVPSKRTIIINGLVRPLKMLCLSPVLLVMSIYIAFAYGVLYLLFNTITVVFQGQYHWSLGISGLVYIPLGLGYVAGLLVFANMSDRTVVRLTKKNNDVFEPEMRLIDCVYFACVMPITFFWYGWSAEKHTHWIVPLLGLFPYGFALMGVWQPMQAYIIDASGEYAASGMAAFAALRSLVATFLPLAGPSMFATLGIGWGNSLLGFICVALIPVPLLFYRYGGYLRKRFNPKLD